MTDTNANIVNNVTVYVPECAVHVSDGSISYAGAQDFQPTQWEYYKGVVPDVLPGVILGGLALLGFVFFLIWMCVQACRLRKARDDADAGEKESLAERFPMSSAPPASAPRRLPCHAIFFIVFTALVGLATIGVAAWGLAASIQGTEVQIPKFWEVIDDINERTSAIQSNLVGVNGSLGTITPGLTVISVNAADLVSLIASSANVTVNASDITGAVNPLLTQISSLSKAASQVTSFVRKEILNRISSIYDNVWTTTHRVQVTYRFIPISVMFGVTILLTMLLLWLAARVRHPKTTSIFVAIYWLDVALLMLLGVGLLRGIFEVSQDACRYSETYAYARIRPKIPANNLALFDRVWEYYIENTTITQPYADFITGAPIDEILTVLQSPDINTTIEALSKVTPALIQNNTGLNSSDAEAISSTSQALPILASNLTELVRQLSRDNLQPMYLEVKVLMCCTLGNKAYNLWVSWTAAGALSFVFAVLLSARVISHTIVTARRYQAREEAMQAAFLVSTPRYEADYGQSGAQQPYMPPMHSYGDVHGGRPLPQGESDHSIPLSSPQPYVPPLRSYDDGLGSLTNPGAGPDHSAPSAPPLQPYQRQAYNDSRYNS